MFRKLAKDNITMFRKLAKDNIIMFRKLANYNITMFRKLANYNIAMFRKLADYNITMFRKLADYNITWFRKLAKDNMPFMALEIHGLQEINIREDLPHSDNMKVRSELRFKNINLSKPGFSVYLRRCKARLKTE